MRVAVQKYLILITSNGATKNLDMAVEKGLAQKSKEFHTSCCSTSNDVLLCSRLLCLLGHQMWGCWKCCSKRLDLLTFP